VNIQHKLTSADLGYWLKT